MSEGSRGSQTHYSSRVLSPKYLRSGCSWECALGTIHSASVVCEFSGLLPV